MTSLFFLLFQDVLSCAVPVGDEVYDLTAIATEKYTVEGPAGDDSLFEASFCSDLAYCSSIGGVLTRTEKTGECHSYGVWDPVKTIKTEHGVEVSFNSEDRCPPDYENPLESMFNFLCDTKAGDLGLLKATKINDCEYSLEIHTNLVCEGSIPVNSNGGNKGLSSGSVLLIVLCALLFGYFLIGLCFNFYKQKTLAIPQRSFWCTKLPYWTKTGCILSWVTTMTVCKTSYSWCCLKIFKAKPGDDQMATALVDDDPMAT